MKKSLYDFAEMSKSENRKRIIGLIADSMASSRLFLSRSYAFGTEI
jgi:hypothetical protein